MHENVHMDLLVEDQLINALEEAQRSVWHFLEFIQLCGFNLSHKEYKKLQFLVRNEDDIGLWFAYFDGNIENIVTTTDLFKESKKNKINLSLTDFLNECELNLKQGLELLFLEECSPIDIRIMNEKIRAGELTLEEMYNTSQLNTWYNSAAKFIKARWNN